MSQLFSHADLPSGDLPTSDPALPESVEELGPGDVQHLRGNSVNNPDHESMVRHLLNWPASELTPDELLQSAERSLTEVILGSMPEPHIAAPQIDPIAQTTNIPQVSTTRQLSSTQPKEPAFSGGLTLDDLGDVELDIAIELGRSELLIDDLMKLREGSVVTLDKLAGDPVDIIANGRLIARGELLVIDGMFGVRLSEVL